MFTALNVRLIEIGGELVEFLAILQHRFVDVLVIEIFKI